MTDYAILLPGDEEAWASSTPAQKEAMYDVHRAFAKRLADRGHVITGGAELAHSRTARILRMDEAGTVEVTDGPYAEAVEQLTGFYLVRTEDLDDLLDVVAMLARPGEAIEVRRCLEEPAPA